MLCVYIVLCSDDSFYIGVTNDVERRVWEHNEGIDTGCYTFKRRPVRLMYASEFPDAMSAIDWEKRIKRWSREKKQALIDGDWKRIKALTHRVMPMRQR